MQLQLKIKLKTLRILLNSKRILKKFHHNLPLLCVSQLPIIS